MRTEKIIDLLTDKLVELKLKIKANEQIVKEHTIFKLKNMGLEIENKKIKQEKEDLAQLNSKFKSELEITLYNNVKLRSEKEDLEKELKISTDKVNELYSEKNEGIKNNIMC